jgi:HKD family nuclease
VNTLATGTDLFKFRDKLVSCQKISQLEEFLSRQGLRKAQANRAVMGLLASRTITITKEALLFEDSEIKFDPSKLSKETDEKEPSGQPLTPIGFAVGLTELVCTAPTRMSELILSKCVVLTESVFRSLIASTKHELIIVSPFLERQGIYAFRSELAELARMRRTVKLLTRKIERDNDRILALFDLFEMFGNLLQVKEFHAEVLFGKDLWRQLESTHAKMLLRDTEEMYLGSAELRQNALYSNFEFGIHTREKTLVDSAAQVFQIFWTDVSSTRVVPRSDIITKAKRLVR